jgi:hypothetical protein
MTTKYDDRLGDLLVVVTYDLIERYKASRMLEQSISEIDILIEESKKSVVTS